MSTTDITITIILYIYNGCMQFWYTITSDIYIRTHFNSVADLDYIMGLVQQAYNYNLKEKHH